jgi:DNA-binding CsgD family transcriptional regulator
VALAAADALRQALLVFDRDGGVLAANRTALEAIGRADLALARAVARGGTAWRLRLARAPLQERLDAALRALGRASDAVGADAAAPGGATRVLALTTEASGQPGLILRLVPLPPGAAGADPERRAVAVGAIVERRVDVAFEPAALCGLFGLTEAEARVALAYLSVDTVKDVARGLGISANTVKKHLCAVYEKTGCARQAQLIRLLMSLT